MRGLWRAMTPEVAASRRGLVRRLAHPSPRRCGLRGARAASFCALVVSFLGKHLCGLGCWERWQ